MPTPAELVDELRRLKPGTPALHHAESIAFAQDELARARAAGRPRDRELERAFAALRAAIAARLAR